MIKKTKASLAVIDTIIILLGVYSSFLARNNFILSVLQIEFLCASLAIAVIAKIALYFSFNVYKISLQYFSLNDVAKLVLANLTFSIVMLIVLIAFQFQDVFPEFYKSIIFYEFFISTFLILAFRASYRMMKEYIAKLHIQKKPVLIFGIDDTTDSVIRYLRGGDMYEPVGILSTRKASASLSINGLEIFNLENNEGFPSKVNDVVIACREDAFALLDIYGTLKRQGFENIQYFNGLNQSATVANVSLEELLSRDEQLFDDEKVHHFISGRTILITGAGGSIGSELVRQCFAHNAKLIIMVDNCEYNLYKMSEKIRDERVVPVLLSVLDDELDTVFQKYKPEIVIHAAAYKHVPMAEDNGYTVFKNNIIGTKNCIDCSIENGVEKFILISTDKAVRPTNIMGATKRVCELYAQNIHAKNTKIITVRFGNVLNSSGSVIPKFKQQIENGGPVTVTHPDITRYFMLINEACKLVLYAGTIGEQQELMVLNMGEPVKIADFAATMIALSGHSHIPIVFTGLRSGEKLYEELLISKDDIKTENDLIYISKSTTYEVQTLINEIESVLKHKNVTEGLQQMVKEFTPKEKNE